MKVNRYLQCVLILLVCLLQACATSGGKKSNEFLLGNAAQAPLSTNVSDKQKYHYALGLMSARKYGRAKKLLLAIESTQKKRKAFYENLAIVYLNLDDDVNAQSVLNNMLKKNSVSASAQNIQAILHRRAGRFKQAHEIYEAILKSQPDYANAHMNLAILCELYMQDDQCALRHYKIYQNMAVNKEKVVDGWIVDIESRMMN